MVFLVLGDNPNFTSIIKKGLHLRKRGLMSQAIKTFKEAAVLDRYSNIPEVFLSQTLEMLGDQEKADEVAFIEPWIRLHGGMPVVIDTVYSQAMIHVATKKPNLFL